MRKIFLIIFAFTLSLNSYGWTEKWPVDIKITPENFVSTFLRANFGKVGELAAKQLDDILNDPKKQAKLAQSTINKLNSIYQKYLNERQSNEERARENAARDFIAAIEEDIGTITSAPSGQLNIRAAYSAKYGVTRLIWDRVKTTAACQRFECRCPDGSSRPAPGFMCQVVQTIGGQQYYTNQPVACQIPTDQIEMEAGYEVYRNSKLIAVFNERRSTLSSTTLPINGSLGPFSYNLNITFPSTAKPDNSSAGPFYDFDPQNEDYGTPLRYTIKAKGSGCGNYNASTPYNNSLAYAMANQGDIIVDGDGDAIPDFYPGSLFLEKRLGEPSAHVQLVTPVEYPGMNQWNVSQITATVAGNSPTGFVTFYVDGKQKFTRPVVNGTVTALTEELVGGCSSYCSHQVIGQYTGDSNNPTGWNTFQLVYQRD